MMLRFSQYVLLLLVLLLASCDRRATDTPAAPTATSAPPTATTFAPTSAQPTPNSTATSSPTAAPTQAPTEAPASPTAIPTLTASPAATATVAPTTPTTYTVQPGDNLFRIGLRFNVTVDVLRAANGLTSDLIYVGQVLVIPGAGVTTTAPPAATQATQTRAAPTGTGQAWDPNARVVRYVHDFQSGGEFYSASLNFLPDVQVWGDGRIIWAASAGRTSPGRFVYQGTLTREQMQALIDRIQNVAFFTWQDSYGRDSLYTAVDTLAVNLTSQSKTVTVYDAISTELPAGYTELTAFLATGAGLTPGPSLAYTPARAYLTATATGGAVAGLPNWPGDSTGVRLDQLGSGRYIQGELLDFAWELVNANPRQALVQSNGAAYSLALQIPGVSFQEPPP